MKLNFFFLFQISILIGFGQATGSGEKQKYPIDVSGFSQLFIDDYVIEYSNNLTKTQNTAIKLPNPVIVADLPWEKNVYVYGSVITEEGFYRMYYRCSDSTGRKFVSYAESLNGVTWNKPFLGVFNYNGNLNNNILFEGIEISSVVVDLEDIPERRYKMYGYYNLSNAYVALASADGISGWEIFAYHLYGGDVGLMNYDPYTKQYVVVYKIPEEYPYYNYRKFWLATSPDLINYSPGVLLENQVDSLDLLTGFSAIRVDPYGFAFFPYEGAYIGFNWIFYIENIAFGGGTHIGPIDVHLSYNRSLDGNWYRPFRNAILPLGEDGDWDDGMIFTSSYPIIMGDEVWLYYGGWNDKHGMLDKKGEIGIVRWRLDGFVSMKNKPGDGEGILITKSMVFQDNHLSINADASEEDAYVIAELCNPDGSVIPGFSRDEFYPITSNSVRHSAAWEDGDDLSSLAGQPVVLKLYVKNADVFSFKFETPEVQTNVSKPLQSKSIDDIVLYPNPANNQISISALEKINKISIYSNNGTLIKKIIPASALCTIDVSSLKQGIYYVRVEIGNKVITRKFSKL